MNIIVHKLYLKKMKSGPIVNKYNKIEMLISTQITD